MKLLGSGFTVSESTFAGTTISTGGQGMVNTGFTIRKIVAFCGGTSVAANSSGGIIFSHGPSSAAVVSTLVVLPTPGGANAYSSAVPSNPITVTLDGFSIKCNWFEARSNEAAAGGWGIFVFGD